jgi:hypothetical protein
MNTPMNPHLQQDLEELLQGHFAADEALVWAGECGYQDCFGYVVVSTRRVVTAVFDPTILFGGSRQRVVFYKPKRGLLGKLSAFQAERATYLAPDSPLTAAESGKRKLYEAPLAKITGVSRQDYPVTLKSGETTTMVELTFLTEENVVIDRPILYTKAAGDELQTLVQGMLAAPTDRETAVHTSTLLASLTKLHEAGLLSDEEFASKQQALLDQK